MKSILAALMLTSFSIAADAEPSKDVCHVFVLDVAKAKKTFEELRKAGDKDAEAKAHLGSQLSYPEFRPLSGNEQLTTQHYPFPNGNVVITASVYYTDKSMGSRVVDQSRVNPRSIVIGILFTC